MKDIGKILFKTVAIALALAAISCSDDSQSYTPQVDSDSVVEDNSIKFKVEVDSYATRGTLVEDASQMTNFSFTSYVTSDESGETVVGDVHCENIMVVRDDYEDGVWVCDGAVILWPSDPNQGLLFRAYSPYATGVYDAVSNPDGNGLVFNADEQSTRNFVVSYTMPSNIANQPDLLVAEPQYESNVDAVPLSFSHVLAALSFGVKGDTNKRITSISLKNIITSGSLTIDAKDMSNNWTYSDSDTSTYDVDILLGVEPNDTDAGASLTASDGNVMVLPQTLPSDATLIVEYYDITDESVVYTPLELNLSSSIIWREEIKYNYVINFTTTIIEATETDQ